MIVHNVEVHDVCAGREYRCDVLAKAREVCREN